MRLLIYKSDKVDDDFIRWLLPSIYSAVLSKLNNSRLVVTKKLLSECGITSDPRAVILRGLRALHIRENKDAYVIEIHPMMRYGSTRYSIKDVCSMIEYGNMNNPGTGVFEEAFNEVKNNITHLYSNYIMEFL